MKTYFLFLLLIISSLASAHETSSGGGADNCPGPRFTFKCIVSAKVMDFETVKKVITFNNKNQRSFFGKEGRYDVRFCPFRSSSKKWMIHITAYDSFPRIRGLGYVVSALTIPIEQSVFEMEFGIQHRGDQNHADSSNDAVQVNCTQR